MDNKAIECFCFLPSQSNIEKNNMKNYALSLALQNIDIFTIAVNKVIIVNKVKKAHQWASQ